MEHLRPGVARAMVRAVMALSLSRSESSLRTAPLAPKARARGEVGPWPGAESNCRHADFQSRPWLVPLVTSQYTPPASTRCLAPWSCSSRGSRAGHLRGRAQLARGGRRHRGTDSRAAIPGPRTLAALEVR